MNCTSVGGKVSVNPDGAILSVPPSDAGALARGRAWPRPFFDRVQMEFVLPAAMPVRMEVLDVRGRRVWESGTKPLTAGNHVLAWDGQTSDGRITADGICFLRVRGSGPRGFSAGGAVEVAHRSRGRPSPATSVTKTGPELPRPGRASGGERPEKITSCVVPRCITLAHAVTGGAISEVAYDRTRKRRHFGVAQPRCSSVAVR